jgi:hypothetical protein
MFNSYPYQPDQTGGQIVPFNANHMTQERAKVCYQVDFNAVAVGKVIAMSKRRIRW